MVLVCHRTTDKCTWEPCTKDITLPPYSCTSKTISMKPWECYDLEAHQIKNICDRALESKFDIGWVPQDPPLECKVSNEWKITSAPTSVATPALVHIFEVDTSGWNVDLSSLAISWLLDWAKLRFRKCTPDANKIIFNDWVVSYNFVEKLWEYYCIIYNECDDEYHIA